MLYAGEKFSGSMYVLSEGDYPNLSSMALPADSRVRSVRAVPVVGEHGFIFTVSVSGYNIMCWRNDVLEH